MKKLTSILSTIAPIAIVWYICTYYISGATSWWILPLLTLIITTSSILLPVLVNKFISFWSILSTGTTLLIFQTIVKAFSLTSDTKMWFLAILIFVVAIITEILVHGFGVLHIAEILCDIIAAILFAWLIVLISAPIVTVVYLLIYFIFVILIDFKAGFCLKHNTKKDESDEIVETANSEE